jgi:hypothetical protein
VSESLFDSRDLLVIPLSPAFSAGEASDGICEGCHKPIGDHAGAAYSDGSRTFLVAHGGQHDRCLDRVLLGTEASA